MQTILGAGGAIGTELAIALQSYTSDIRLVSRTPNKVNDSDELFPADLTNAFEVDRAVEGSKVVYLTAGLTYNIGIWRKTWPVIMQNVIKACQKHNARLVFFDNIYMYDPDSIGNIREDNPINPGSEKGKVRAAIANRLMDAVNNNELVGLIARSADFYGPGIVGVSVMTESIFKPFSEGKKAALIGKLDKKHSFTYTPDAAKATALLGNTEDAFGEVWHLPTASDPPTMQWFVDTIAGKMGVEPRVQVANKFMTRMIGLFVPIMKELVEMYYQYDRDYVFNSSKFEERFDFKPTPYEKGIDEVVRLDYS